MNSEARHRHIAKLEKSSLVERRRSDSWMAVSGGGVGNPISS